MAIDLSKYKLPNQTPPTSGVDLSKYKVINPQTPQQPTQSSQGFADKIWSGLAGVQTGIAKGIASVPFDLASAGESILRPTVGAAVHSLTGKPQPAPIEKPASLTPQGTAEKIGFGAEKIGEFFIPQSAILKGEKAIEAGISGLKIAQQGGKIAKTITATLQLGARSLAEAGSTAAITALQGGNEEEIKRNSAIAGIIPVVGKGLSVLSGMFTPLASVATGVPKETLARAKTFPQEMDQAITHVTENPTQPFFSLANTIKDKFVAAKEAVQKTYTDAVDAFKAQFPKARFDLNPYFKQFTNPLKEFPTLKLEQVDKRLINETGTVTNEVTGLNRFEMGREKLPQEMSDLIGVKGKGSSVPTIGGEKIGVVKLNAESNTIKGFGTTYKITKTTQSPFTEQEVGALNQLLNKIQASRNIDIDNLIGLRQSFDRAYGDIPFANGRPTPYHAAVMALKDNAEKVFQEVMPQQMKAANAAYKNFIEVSDKTGKKLVDASGNLVQGAESYLSNLLNMNKGEIQKEVGKLEELTGIPIANNVQFLKDAQRLTENFPRTGSRTQDILRSLLTLRGAAGGAAGFAAGGIPGAVAGVAATSPRVAGKAFTLTGKAAQELSGLAQKYPEVADFVKRFAGSSLK